MPNDDQLINKYRPQLFKRVLGQDAVVNSIKTVLEQGTARSFLFAGSSGCGKTTIARIIAKKVGVEARNVTEVDAASNTGVEDMRTLTASLAFNVLGGSGKRMFIIDECHRLSAQAWDSLLKSIEEPPAGMYWALCTTSPEKVPVTIRKGRVQYHTLKPVSKELIFELLKGVAEQEGFTATEDVLYLIAEKCDGSPRDALAALSKCSGCTSRKEAAGLIQAVTEEGEAYELCQLLMKGATWETAMDLLKRVKDDIASPESFRIMLVNYFSKVIMDAKDTSKAQKVAAVLQAFAEPYPQGATLAQVILSLATLLL